MTTLERTLIFVILFYLFLKIFGFFDKKKEKRETKHRVGDVVKVKTKHWYNSNKDSQGTVVLKNDYEFDEEYSHYCGYMLTIVEVGYNYYFVEENDYLWTDDMFE